MRPFAACGALEKRTFAGFEYGPNLPFKRRHSLVPCLLLRNIDCNPKAFLSAVTALCHDLVAIIA